MQPDHTPPPANRRWWGKTPTEAIDDSVHIDEESEHDWWAKRDELTLPAAPVPTGTDAPLAPIERPAAFAPAPPATRSGPPPGWDVDSLRAWASTTGEEEPLKAEMRQGA